MNSSENVGKLSVGKHKRLKSEFLVFKLSLFSVLSSKFNSELEDIFLSMSYRIAAEVVVLPSLRTFMSDISSENTMSKSVATICNFLFFNCKSTFERIGRVFFFSTTP